jgi:hypothetical protein
MIALYFFFENFATYYKKREKLKLLREIENGEKEKEKISITQLPKRKFQQSLNS